MKRLHTPIFLLSLSCAFTPASAARVEVHGGALVLDLAAPVLATEVTAGFYDAYGLSMTPGQPHLVVGRYFSMEDMVWRKLIGAGLRPDLNGLRPVNNVGTSTAPVWSVDLRQFRSVHDLYPVRTSGMLFGVYDVAPAVLPGSLRAPVGTDFSIDESGDPATSTGIIGFGGAISFLYANDAFLGYPNSGRYFTVGDFHLQREEPAPESYSEWVLYSNIMGTTPIFFTRDVQFAVAGGVLTITGDLYGSPDLDSFTALASGIRLGSFRFTSEPITPREAWRRSWFGSVANAGPGADEADPDGNGLLNLVEYAAYADPQIAEAAPVPALLPSVATNGVAQIAFRCARHRPDVTLTVQGADTPVGPWTDLAVSAAGAPVASLVPGVTVGETSICDTRLLRVSEPPVPGANTRVFRLIVTAP